LPKLKVPCCISSCSGSVIGAEEALSTRVQLAFVSSSSKVFEPELGVKKRLVIVPTPTRVLLVTPLDVLVQPPPMMSFEPGPLVPPLNVLFAALELIGREPAEYWWNY